MGGERALFRVGLVREGSLRNGSVTAPCVTTELTTQGIGLRTELRSTPEDRLDVTFSLADQDRISRTLRVTHANRPRLGGCITAISAEHRQQLARYIDDHASISLTTY